MYLKVFENKTRDFYGNSAAKNKKIWRNRFPMPYLPGNEQAINKSTVVVAFKLRTGQVMLLLQVLPYWAPIVSGLFFCPGVV
jgi:hypothetical protein